MSDLFQPLLALIHMVVSFLNGLIVGILTFVVNLLDGLDSVDGLLTHGISAVSDFFEAFLQLGELLFPFLPAEWSAILEAALLLLAVGLLLKKKVIG